MLAKDVMTPNVVAVAPETSIHEIARLLLQRQISGVPVLEDDGNLVGLVSEGDLIRRVEPQAEDRRSWWLNLLTSESEKARAYVVTHGRSARDVMPTDVVTIPESAELGEIARLLEERQIKRVPVMRDQKVVGIVSRSNLLQGLASSPATAAESDDLRTRVIAALDGLDWLHPTQMNVIVANGAVEVWGYVETAEQKSAMRVAVENVEGVENVRDHVGIMPHYLAGA